MDILLSTLAISFAPEVVGALLFGSIFGLVFGAIPGLTYTMALALILPLTFTLDHTAAIAMLLSTFIGGASGGTVAAILVGVPGTPSSAATVVDGHRLAKAGKASLTVAMATVVSTIGGLFSLIVMVFSVDFLASVALHFGPAEIFALLIFGMSTICGLAERSIVRGLIGGVIGLMVMIVGQDPIDGVSRLTFGQVPLLQGVELLVAMIALFAIPQVVEAFSQHHSGGETVVDPNTVKVELPRPRYVWGFRWNIFRSSLLGTVIGAIPGTSGTIAAFLAYSQEKKLNKDKVAFGHGNMGGVVAPETSNNAVTGGSMIPVLGLGIPSDPATALILGGLLIHGIQPGPLLFVENPQVIYSIYMLFAASYVIVMIFMLFGVRLFVKALHVPHHLLALAIMVLCIVGSYSVRNSMFDVGTMIVIGFLGYLLQKARIPLTPILLGLVLGPAMEREFRTAMIMSSDDPSIFYTSPTALLFFAFAAIVVFKHTLSGLRSRNNQKKEA
ncbi:C4-dicarboxylate ABC transporter permease [Nitratireductor aestuarii]|uniref:C4-dicarboxylate ABC transporter permease n=1 Tax=Nitratireductor aestuarii TaxID=1735103 RepID=A0A916RJM8_9HYPH|nr:tripartite tricarboxylate transporter permease [Nitratireductor aestuarii]GGA59035.1 C4-dicarboxylate ABC transporter permease [Nitratireductor aestuarii]